MVFALVKSTLDGVFVDVYKATAENLKKLFAARQT